MADFTEGATRTPAAGAASDADVSASTGCDQTEAADDGWEWAAVEIFGRRRHCGRTREERFGSKLVLSRAAFAVASIIRQL